MNTAHRTLTLIVALALAASASAQPSLLGVATQERDGQQQAEPARAIAHDHGFAFILERTPTGARVRITAPSERAADVTKVTYNCSPGPSSVGQGDGWAGELVGNPGDAAGAYIDLRRTPAAWESWPILSFFAGGPSETIAISARLPGPRAPVIAPVIRGLDLAFTYGPSSHGYTNGSFAFHAKLTGDLLARVRAIDVHHRDQDGRWKRIARITDPSQSFSGELQGAYWNAYLMVRDARGRRWSQEFDPRDPGQFPLRIDIELEGLTPVKDFLVAVPAPADVAPVPGS